MDIQKRGKATLSLEVSIDQGSITSFMDDLNKLLKRYELSEKSKEIKAIPSSVFTKGLGISEAAVKYLREEKGFSNDEISKMLGKSKNNISATYSKACEKAKGRLAIKDSKLIPLEYFTEDNLSTFESVVYNLHKAQGLSFSLISGLLDRDARTIWATYKRAEEKA